MHLPSVIKELLELTDLPQHKLAKRLGTSQGSISRWLTGKHEPTKAQWDRIYSLYSELKGWRHSIDAKIAPYDQGIQDDIHEIVDRILKNVPPSRRR